EGAFLKTVRIGRMPEKKKATLKDMLSSELGRAFAERPDLTLVAIADEAKDNWLYYDQHSRRLDHLCASS
ncbi:MAG: hypothetical protein GY811_13780, partial [Myxococcales bacterium]|nr:hypothetical protein [Myxococcales bacterium]